MVCDDYFVVAGGVGKEGEVESIYGGAFKSERWDDKFDQVWAKMVLIIMMVLYSTRFQILSASGRFLLVGICWFEGFWIGLYVSY